jgi:methionyl-tRNA formyltransferase
MTMNTINVLFFGSSTDSVSVLEKLCQAPGLPAGKAGIICQAVVTQPPRPTGRTGIITPTPVELWAKQRNIPVLTFPSNGEKNWLYENEQTVINTLAPLKTDLVISASYGVKIPAKTISDARYGGLNIHPSILPRWRGADPVPWAILKGDHRTGVTVVTLSEEFDKGRIVAQKIIPITDTDTSDPLRSKLFIIGADLLITSLPAYLTSNGLPVEPPKTESASSYARKFTREDGFEPWKSLIDTKESVRIYRKFRALHPWPGIWTTIRIMSHESGITEEKRLKIVSCHIQPATNTLQLDSVQLEGKKPVGFIQFRDAYLSKTP